MFFGVGPFFFSLKDVLSWSEFRFLPLSVVLPTFLENSRIKDLKRLKITNFFTSI